MERRGEIVEVRDGYARNVLLKKNQGVEATGKNLNDLKLQKANDAKIAQEQLEAAQALKAEIEAEDKKVILKMKTGGGRKNIWFYFFQGDCGCGKGAARI